MAIAAKTSAIAQAQREGVIRNCVEWQRRRPICRYDPFGRSCVYTKEINSRLVVKSGKAWI